MFQKERHKGEQESRVALRLVERWRKLYFFRTSALVLLLLFHVVLAASLFGETVSRAFLYLSVAVGLASCFWLYRRSRRGSIWQVHFLENHLPILRDRLTTIHEWETSGRTSPYDFSEALYEQTERDLGEALRSSHLKRDLSLRRFWQIEGLTLLAAFIPSAFLMPFLFLGGLSFMGNAIQAPDGHTFAVLKMGDLEFKRIWPSYTGEADANWRKWTNQKVEVLQGSKLELRGEVFDPASALNFLSPSGDILATTETKGKRFEYEILPLQSGTHRIMAEIDDETKASRGLEISMLRDAFPKAQWTEGVERSQSVDFDDELSLDFKVEDDFGIREVGFRIEGRSFQYEVPFDGPFSRKETFRNTILLKNIPLPRRLREVDLYISVTDNDAVGGFKKGKSESIQLVFDEAERERREKLSSLEDYQSRSIEILGDEIEKLWLVLQEGGGPILQAFEKQLLALADFHEVLSEEPEADPLLGHLRQETQASIDQHQELLSKWSKKQVIDIEPEIIRWEELVLLIDRGVTEEGINQVDSEFQRLSDNLNYFQDLLSNQNQSLEQEQLQEEFDLLKNSLRRLFESINQVSDQSSLQEFINPEALAESQWSKLLEEMQEIENLLAQGDTEKAREKMQDVLSKLQSMMEEMGEGMAQGQRERDEELAEDLSNFQERVSAILEEQEKLTRESREVLAEQLEKESQRLQEIQKKLEKLANRAKEEMSDASDRVGQQKDDRLYRLRLVPLIDGTKKGIERLLEEIKDTDLERALAESSQARRNMAAVEREMERLLRRESTSELGEAIPPINRADSALKELEEMIREGMEKRLSNPRKPIGKMSKNQSQQKKLEQSLEELQKDSSNLLRKLPMAGSQMSQSIEGGKQEMAQASEEMKKGEWGQTVVHQEQAEEELRTLLEQAQSMQEPGGSGGSGFMQRGMQGGMNRINPDPVIIPKTDESPEFREWRQDILDELREVEPGEDSKAGKEYLEGLIE